MESRCKVKTVVPNIPTWAVYYDAGLDVLTTFPVLWYEAEWDDEDKEYGSIAYWERLKFTRDLSNRNGVAVRLGRGNSQLY